MPTEPFTFLKPLFSLVSWLASPILKRRWNENRARAAMVRGGIAKTPSLQNEVGSALQRLLSGELPGNLETPGTRAWVSDSLTQVALLSLLQDKLADQPTRNNPALQDAAKLYESYTGEDRRLAAGAIDAVLDGLVQILFRSAEPSIRLQIGQIAALSSAIHRKEFDGESGVDIKAKTSAVRLAAEQELSGSKSWWRFPKVRVPIQFHRIESGNENEEVATTTDIVEYVLKGINVSFSGEAGAGKTITMLEIAEALNAQKSALIPIYVDAAVWATSGRTLLEFIPTLPSFLEARISPADLACLYKSGNLVVLLNGWNEISDARQIDARRLLQSFLTGCSTPRILVTSRIPFELLGPSKTIHWKAKGLDWKRQKELIRTRLSSDKAAPLLERLATDASLRTACRNPLVITGVIELQKNAVAVPSNAFDIFDEIVRLFESEPERKEVLLTSPLNGHSNEYLEAIAVEMNMQSTTILENTTTRQAISKVGNVLERSGQVRAIEPDEVLRALCNQHLLQMDSQQKTIRFAHQRFQEFFAAKVLLKILFSLAQEARPSNEKISELVNLPFWEDAFLLVAEKLRDDGKAFLLRGLLLKAAMPVDLAFASKLAGLMRMTSGDGESWEQLEELLRRLYVKSNLDCADYVLECIAACRSSKFSDVFWPLLEGPESESGQFRDAAELSHGLEIQQLGSGAIGRIANWPEERRSRILNYLARNSRNHQYVEQIARTDLSVSVRAKAIETLSFWRAFPDTARKAWLEAPDDVKSSRSAIEAVLYEWQPTDEIVTKELIRLALNSDDAALKLRINTLLFEYAGVFGVDAVKHALEKKENEHIDQQRYSTFLAANDPTWLDSFIESQMWSTTCLPQWASKRVEKWDSQVRTALFDKAWQKLLDVDHLRLDVAVVMRGASQAQIQRLFEEGMRLDALWPGRRFDEIESKNFRAIECLLVNSPPEILMGGILSYVDVAPYKACGWLVGLFERCLDSESRRNPNSQTHRIPSIQELDALIAAVAGKTETAEVKNCRLETFLSKILARVDPVRYLPYVLETARKHLGAWQDYRISINEFAAKPRGGERPNSPSLGNYLSSALFKCGFDAIPGLLALLNEPESENVVFEPLVAIVAGPWRQLLGSTYAFGRPDLRMAAMRRARDGAGKQPEDALQRMTDEVAVKMCARLKHAEEEVERLRLTASPEIGAAVWFLARILELLAQIPSPHVLGSVLRALNGHSIDPYKVAGIAAHLVEQGFALPADQYVKPIEAAIEQLTTKAWLDDQSRYLLSRLVILLLFVEPVPEAVAVARNAMALSQGKADFWGLRNQLLDANIPAVVPLLAELFHKEIGDRETRDRVIASLVSNSSNEAGEALLDILLDPKLRQYLTTRHFHFRDVSGLARKIAIAAKSDDKRRSRVLAAIRSDKSEIPLDLALAILNELESEDEFSVMVSRLDTTRHPEDGPLIEEVLGKRFSDSRENGQQGYFEVHPLANNELRKKLLQVALSEPTCIERTRRILLAIELDRAANGRPSNEPRHPEIETGIPWPAALIDA